MIGLGIAYQSLGQYQRAIDFYRQSLEIQREIGDRSVLDQQVIEDLCEVDALEEAIELYLETSPLLLQGIAQAAASGDPLALRRAAHCLRSISGTLGAFRLYELCQELEVMGRMGTASDKSLSGEASVLLQQVEAEYARVAAALQLELIVKCHAATAELNATRSTK
ncbi:MAG: tetratricopeptide repeat protein [Oscillatoriales cyanobacterium RU_3_3]|nr:tetratricopeptide repeat protein [Microcoleus sp. SU_5_6]NJL66959.1 tetratricopeptide repeat protein [Microcoleus sp. SM1_3_4]NJM63086.1 tetratricopeptide repeat protein [Oscillatoriales cyanobacterium RU_3_3]NJR23642.1 tetratricopeptide repeat protein [Richelia sp. CSU_2_1]